MKSLNCGQRILEKNSICANYNSSATESSHYVVDDDKNLKATKSGEDKT